VVGGRVGGMREEGMQDGPESEDMIAICTLSSHTSGVDKDDDGPAWDDMRKRVDR
jgi:hypothetical protein